MKQHANELSIPQEVLEDSNALELFRIWHSNNKEHITMQNRAPLDPTDLGALLANIAIYCSVQSEQHEQTSQSDSLKQILQGFKNEIANHTLRGAGKH